MRFQPTLACIAGLAAVICAGCEQAKSANPLSPDVAGPIPGVTITAPTPLLPSAGSDVTHDGKPQTLLFENASSSGQREMWLEIQVASDGAFQQVLHQSSRVSLGPSGRTSYSLPEPLGSGHTYYWRARAQDGANVGPYSSVWSFRVVDPVLIEAPTPIEPRGTLQTNRPNFKVQNARVTGPAGATIYRFEIATSLDPASTVAVVTASPGADGTTTVSIGDMPYDRTFYWRVWATDGNTNSAYSQVLSFRTVTAPLPPPTPQPPTPGGGGTSPLPGGSGGRAPDPGPGQRLPLPNMFHVVQQVAASRPDLLANSCQEHGGSWGFMDVLVDTLRTYDTRWGYNWKRGNVGDPSMDVIDYHYGAGKDEGSTEVYIIDVIGGHCGAAPSPVWNDVTGATAAGGSIGRWTGRGRF